MVEIIKTFDELIQEELQEWHKMGIMDPVEPGILSPNQFLESVKLRAIITALMDLGIIDQEKMDQAYKRAMLDSLGEARASMIEMRKHSLGVPTMVIPKNKLH